MKSVDLVRPVASTVSVGELWHVRELISLGDYISSGPWLGRVVVMEVFLDVDVVFVYSTSVAPARSRTGTVN